MSQVFENLTTAVNDLTATTPAIVAALQTAGGTPDAAIQPLADAVSSALSQIKAALPVSPAA